MTLYPLPENSIFYDLPIGWGSDMTNEEISIVINGNESEARKILDKYLINY